MALSNKIFTHAFAVLFGLSFVLLHALLFETHPIKSYYRVVNPLDVQPGQVVSIVSDVERAKSLCASTIKRQFINQSGTIIKETVTEQPPLPAGMEHFRAFVSIPHDAQPGVLRMRVSSKFSCNKLQYFFGTGDTLVLPDVIFTVKAST